MEQTLLVQDLSKTGYRRNCTIIIASTLVRYQNLIGVFFRVVTGLKFTKKNRIIHLQIQQGELAPKGNIKNGTVEWIPVDEYKITDRNIYNGQDYHTLTSERRTMDLDNLIADDGYVVTGGFFAVLYEEIN